MTWIKICGTTNFEDALMSVEAGADALGFVFYEKSPRYITPEAAGEIIEKLPANIEKFGVFVNGSISRVEEAVSRTGVTGVQIHMTGLDADKTFQLEPLSVRQKFLAFPANHLDEGFILSLKNWKSSEWLNGIFLDSGTPQEPGGTGKAFDWEKARPIAEIIRRSGFNIVVAGGLTPDNVAEAIRILYPWGVDVVSGVEVSPGKKDPQKVRAFISAVRQREKTHR